MSVIANEGELKAVAEEIRGKKNSANWAVWGYKDGESLYLLEKGPGGFEAVSAFAKDDTVVYILLGVPTAEGDYSLTKYVLITWVGPSVKPKQRARSSPHRLLLYNEIDKHLQLTTEYQALNRDEFTLDKIREKLAGARDLSEEQLRKAALKDKEKRQPQPAQKSEKAEGDTPGAPFMLANEVEATAAVQQLRDERSSVDWVLFGYEDENKIAVKAKGAGRLEQVRTQLRDDDIAYIALRVIQTEGDFATMKFLFISWVGPQVKAMQKAKSSLHRLPLFNFINRTAHLHAELQALSQEDLSDTVVQQKLQATRTLAEAGDSSKGASAIASRAKGKTEATIANEAEAKAALEALRKDVDWVLFGYKDESAEAQVHLLSKGRGGLKDIVPHFRQDNSVFAVLGVTHSEEVAEYGTVKYVFLAWVGESVKPFVKARASQHRWALYNFAKLHVQLAAELQASTRDEISEELIKAKLAGSRVANLGEGESAQVREKAAAQKETGKAKLEFNFANEADVKSALADLRAQKVSWLLFGYEGDADTIHLKSRGRGDLSELRSSFTPDTTVYAVLNVKDESEGEYAVMKRVFISWVGSAVRTFEKARSSQYMQHRLPLYQYINGLVSLAGEIQATLPDEITDNIIQQKLSGARQLDEASRQDALRRAAIADAEKRKAQTKIQSTNPGQQDFTAAFKLPESDLNPAMAHIRSQGATAWAAWTYADSNTLRLSQTGLGLSDAKATFQDNTVVYLLYAHLVQEGDYSTVKNVLITWVGSAVKPIPRARTSAHRVDLYNLLNRVLTLAGELSITGNKDELTEALVDQKLSGSRVALQEKQSPRNTPAKSASSAATERRVEKLQFQDEEEVKKAVTALRDDKDPTDWVLFGYSGDKVKVVGRGTKGVSEATAALKDDELAYGVFRVNVKDEDEGKDFGYTTFKFIFVSWVGPSVKPLQKAKSSQFRLLIYQYLQQFVAMSGELQALSREEISQEKIMEKISGSRQKY